MATLAELNRKWNRQKGKLKQKFPILTDSDLLHETGGKDAVLEKLQEKLGKTKEELLKIIQAF